MKTRFRVSPSLVISILSLFVALTAGAYAVSKAPKDSVVSKSIRNGKVKSVDIKDGNITGADVRGNSLTGADVDESTLSLPTADVSEAPGTATGPAGGDLAGTYPNPLIADGSVDSAAVADSSLTAIDLAADSVAGSELTPNAVGAAHVVDGAIGVADLGTNAVDEDELRANAVHSDELAVGSVTGAKVSDNSISGADLQLSPHVASVDSGANQGFPKEVTATCVGGRTAISGSAYVTNGGYPVYPVLTALQRVDSDTYRAEAIETEPDSDTSWGLRLDVFCMHL